MTFLAAHALEAFARDDRSHAQRGEWVGPPPSHLGVERHAGEREETRHSVLTMQPDPKAPTMTDSGKYVVVWKK